MMQMVELCVGDKRSACFCNNALLQLVRTKFDLIFIYLLSMPSVGCISKELIACVFTLGWC